MLPGHSSVLIVLFRNEPYIGLDAVYQFIFIGIECIFRAIYSFAVVVGKMAELHTAVDGVLSDVCGQLA